MSQKTQDILYGIHPIESALKNPGRQCHKIVLEEGKPNERLSSLISYAKKMGVRIEFLPKNPFRKKYGAHVHQGIIGIFSPIKLLELEEFLDSVFQITPNPIIALLDEIQDPQNMGAIIRSAYFLGIQGIIIPKRRTVPLNKTVAKCASGALEYLPVAEVTNLARTIEKLKKSQFWIIGIDAKGERPCFDMDFKEPTALIIGGENKGIRPLIKKSCDVSISIPMANLSGSLNASVAGSIIFYEILRQRKSLSGSPQIKKPEG